MVKLQVINLHTFPVDAIRRNDRVTGAENLFIYIGRKSSYSNVTSKKNKWGFVDVKDFSIFGNPYLIRPGGMTATEAVKEYESYLLEIMKDRLHPLRTEFENLFLYLTTIKNTCVYFICFCAPRTCHGEVLIRYMYKNYLQNKKGVGVIWSHQLKQILWKD